MNVGILGGGQLARMLALAGHPLGVAVHCVEPASNSPASAVASVIEAELDDTDALDALASRCEVVTVEIEHVPIDSVARIANRTAFHPNVEAVRAAGDRLLERRAFERAGVPVAPYRSAASAEELEAALADLGTPALVKARRGGYDGRGQIGALSPDQAASIWAELGERPVIVEALVPFERELSLVSVRGTGGDLAFYPLVENRHRNGILRMTIAPAQAVTPSLRDEAEAYAKDLLEQLDYVGVLTIEFFEVGGRLVANEMAPRVHNSGHWTIEGAACSQFENHLRAITGLPLGATTPRGPTVMVNCIGHMPAARDVLAIPGTSYHRYGKQPRPGRKLGHVTVTAPDEQTLASRVRAVAPLVDEADLEIGRSARSASEPSGAPMSSG